MAEKEYIERKALMHDIMRTVIVSEKTGYTNPELKGINKVIDRIKAQPTADVQEVRHGKWVKHKFDPQFLNTLHSKGEAKGIREKNIFWTCSECNNWGTPNQKYCLNCGAKMDKE